MKEESGSKSWLIAAIVGGGFIIMMAAAAFIFWSSFTGEKVYRSVIMPGGSGEVILSSKRVPPYQGSVDAIVTVKDGSGVKVFRETIDQRQAFADFARDFSDLTATDSGVLIGRRFLLNTDPKAGGYRIQPISGSFENEPPTLP